MIEPEISVLSEHEISGRTVLVCEGNGEFYAISGGYAAFCLPADTHDAALAKAGRAIEAYDRWERRR